MAQYERILQGVVDCVAKNVVARRTARINAGDAQVPEPIEFSARQWFLILFAALFLVSQGEFAVAGMSSYGSNPLEGLIEPMQGLVVDYDRARNRGLSPVQALMNGTAVEASGVAGSIVGGRVGAATMGYVLGGLTWYLTGSQSMGWIGAAVGVAGGGSIGAKLGSAGGKRASSVFLEQIEMRDQLARLLEQRYTSASYYQNLIREWEAVCANPNEAVAEGACDQRFGQVARISAAHLDMNYSFCLNAAALLINYNPSTGRRYLEDCRREKEAYRGPG